MNLITSIPYTVVVTLISFGVSWFAAQLDQPLGLPSFAAPILTVLGAVLLVLAFFLRVWAMETFYRHNLRVLWMATQNRLMSDGPFQYSRNPLYVASVAMFLGSSLILGSWTALMLAVVSIGVWHYLILAIEEPSLRTHFGDSYQTYLERVPRWIGRSR